MMSDLVGFDKSGQLAGKLLSEGERTLVFFRALPAEAWPMQIYAEGAQWTVRDILEHLVISEQEMQRLRAQIIEIGVGAPDDFDIDAYNRDETGRHAALSVDALLALFADTRQNTAQDARRMTEAQLARRGRHPAMGDSSIEDIFKIIYLHNTMHIRDIRKRAMSRQ